MENYAISWQTLREKYILVHPEERYTFLEYFEEGLVKNISEKKKRVSAGRKVKREDENENRNEEKDVENPSAML